jgi:3-hydroxyethyl bacteriochlorophyllide a dehydrogenase
VFVPGAKCFGPVRGLFGASASRLVVPGARVIPIESAPDDRVILLALAATAYHAVVNASPDLIIGHGVLGRLAARLAVIAGANPIVWETNAVRREGGEGYAVIGRLARGGEIVLAGFYDRIGFAFPPAFMREARLRIAAEFKDDDLRATTALVNSGKLSLDGLITHRSAPDAADAAYRTAFGDPSCLKMILDWRASS